MVIWSMKTILNKKVQIKNVDQVVGFSHETVHLFIDLVVWHSTTEPQKLFWRGLIIYIYAYTITIAVIITMCNSFIEP